MDTFTRLVETTIKGHMSCKGTANFFAIYLLGVALLTATTTYAAALTFANEPVCASLFGLWLLNERLGIHSYAGGAVILLACVLDAMSDMRTRINRTR